MRLAIYTLSAALALVSVGAPLAAQRTDPTLQLQLVTTYGVLEGRDELGSAGRSVEMANGDVLVLDQVNKRVVRFDAKGGLLGAFGRDGAGPGEFQRPARMSAGPDNTAYVYDAQLKRLAHFSAWLDRCTR